MGGQRFLLTALVPPGSVEAEVGRLQAGLFAEHGLVSTLTLPPLIPILFPAATPPRDFLPELNRSIASGWRMRVAGPTWVDGFLYMAVESGGVWAALRDKARDLCGCGGQGPFPAAEGFFLGCGEASAEQRREMRVEAPALAFTSCAIAVVSFSTPRTDGQWWRELYWETVDERPLRGRREG